MDLWRQGIGGYGLNSMCFGIKLTTTTNKKNGTAIFNLDCQFDGTKYNHRDKVLWVDRSFCPA